MIIQNKLTDYLKVKYTSKHIFLLAFFILCTNFLINIFNQHVLGLGYPHNTFLFIPEDRFADFFKIIDALNIVNTWEGENPYEGMFQAYALPFNTLYLFIAAKLIILTNNKYFIFGALQILLIGLHGFLCRKQGNSYAVLLLSILTYPVIWTIDRGHFAFLVYILLFFALTERKIVTATFGVALATSLKITPAIFIIPVIFKGWFSIKKCIIAIILLLFFILLSNYISVKVLENYLVHQPFSFSEFTKMMGFYYKEDLLSFRGLAYGSSMYMPLLYISYRLHFLEFFTIYFKPVTIPLLTFCILGIIFWIKNYSAITKIILILFFLFFELLFVFVALPGLGFKILFAALSVLSVYSIVLSRFKVEFDHFKNIAGRYVAFDKIVFIISTSFILFTPVSGDYYLLIMFLPILLFPKVKYSFWYVIAYGVLLGAKNFIFIKSTNISLQVFLNPLMLLLILFAEFDLISFMKRSDPAQAHHELNTNVIKDNE
jgi:hypothetical protein